MGWHALDELPELGAATRTLLASAVAADRAEFTFSGLSHVLGPAG